MRIVDLDDNLGEVVEMLRGCAINQAGYRLSCYDLSADEFAAIVGKLHEVARLAITLAEIAVDTLGDSDD
jgi:hypothetical protein